VFGKPSRKAAQVMAQTQPFSLQHFSVRYTHVFRTPAGPERGQTRLRAQHLRRIVANWRLLTGGRIVTKVLRRADTLLTGSTPVENAFRCSEIVNGRFDLIVDGERSPWWTVAQRLSDSDKVLTIMHSRIIYRFQPTMHRNHTGQLRLFA
jgi:hypothetical protein